MLGMFSDFSPKHAKRYARLGDLASAAVAQYVREVRSASFPTEKESFRMNEEVLAEIAQYA